MSRPLGIALLSLSLSRVALGLIILLTFRSGRIDSARDSLILIAIAQITDHLDGFIARKYSTPTVQGYLQDSLGDKIFQFSLLLAISREYLIDPTILWLYFAREVAVLSIRIAAQFNHQTLQRLRIYSVCYAIPLRGGAIAIIAAPLIGIAVADSIDTVIVIGTACIALSFVPATLGIIISLRHLK